MTSLKHLQAEVVENLLGAWIQHHSSWLSYVFLQKNYSVGTAFCGNFNCIESRVQPVNITSNPVVRKTFNEI